MTKDKTIFAIKLRTNKQRAEYFWGLVILVIILGGVIAIGSLQYMICKSKNPNVGFMECIQSKKLKRPVR